MSVDFPTQGSCDSGDCFYVNTVSWRNETTPNHTESHPRIVFERLFGDGGSAEARQARSAVGGQHPRFGPRRGEPRGEQPRRAATRPSWASISTPCARSSSAFRTPRRSRSTSSCRSGRRTFPTAFDAHTKLMFDLQALAFQADITRVFSMIMSRELSTMTFPSIGVPEQHHGVSHHRNDPELIAKKARIDVYQAQLFAYFLEKLQATPDGDGSLLDQSLLLYGGGMGDGNLHRHSDLPTLMAGEPRRHVQDGPPSPVQARHADGQPAADDAGQRRRAASRSSATAPDGFSSRFQCPSSTPCSGAVLRFRCTPQKFTPRRRTV